MKQLFKKKEVDLYMAFCDTVSQMSNAARLKVGAVMVNNVNIVYGFNGTPTGWDNVCEYETDVGLKTKPEVIHAELNALLKCAKKGVSCDGGWLFQTHSPCEKCATSIIQSGIECVVYKTEFRDNTGIKWLKKSGILVIDYNDPLAVLEICR